MEKTAEKKKREVDLTSRPLLKKTILFALPLVLTSVLQLLYNAMDIVVLGQWASPDPEVREAAVGAVGSTGALINLVTNLFLGLSVGALAVVARFIGARDESRVSRASHTALLVSVIGGVLVGLFGVLMSGIMLGWMSTPEEVLPLATLYLRIYFIGMPFGSLYNFGASILRADGDTKSPLIILAVAGIANVGLNVFSVVVLGLGVAGVGIATAVSQAVSAAGVVIVLMRRKGATRLVWRKLRIHKAELIDIVRIGLPAGVQGTVFSLSNVVIQSSINGFGKTAVAGNATAANVEGFVYVAMNSVAQACLTVAGQNYGAAKPKNIDLTLVQCLLLVTGVGLVLGVGAYLCGSFLLGLYGSEGEALAYGLGRMKIICIWYFLCGIMDTLVGALRGIGSSLVPMIVSIIGVVGVRILWIFTVFRAYHTLSMLYISYPVSWVFTLAVHAVCYLVLRKKKFRQLQKPIQSPQSPDGDSSPC